MYTNINHTMDPALAALFPTFMKVGNIEDILKVGELDVRAVETEEEARRRRIAELIRRREPSGLSDGSTAPTAPYDAETSKSASSMTMLGGLGGAAIGALGGFDSHEETSKLRKNLISEGRLREGSDADRKFQASARKSALRTGIGGALTGALGGAAFGRHGITTGSLRAAGVGAASAAPAVGLTEGLRAHSHRRALIDSGILREGSEEDQQLRKKLRGVALKRTAQGVGATGAALGLGHLAGASIGKKLPVSSSIPKKASADLEYTNAETLRNTFGLKTASAVGNFVSDHLALPLVSGAIWWRRPF